MTSPISSPTAAKTLLAISTIGARGSLALGSAQVQWEKKAMHSELATVKLQELLTLTDKTLQDLTHIAVVVGPGSFTGIRVGVNLARTLAYSLAIPVAPFNALGVLARRHLRDGERGVVALRAVQRYFYAAAYLKQPEGLLEITPPTSVEHEAFASLAHGPAKVLIEQESTGFSTEIQALDLVQWLDQWPNSKHFFSWKEIKPLYIRASEAEEKLRQGLLKPL